MGILEEVWNDSLLVGSSVFLMPVGLVISTRSSVVLILVDSVLKNVVAELVLLAG